MKKTTTKDLTNILTQVDVVVISVYLLGGDARAIDTEEIAVKCHSIAPGMFAWRKYPEQINLELVRVALSNAKKKQSGTLLQGAGREGWRLTTQGLEWCQRTMPILEVSKIQWDRTRRNAGSVDSRRTDRERHRIMNSLAWKTWTEKGELSVSAAKELFRIDGYASESMAEAKIVRLQSVFQNDSKVKPFLMQAGKLVSNNKEDNNV